MVELASLNSVSIITIDGPSASGKGTVAQKVASRLGFHYLDSGALYRLVALAALNSSTLLDAETDIARIAATLDVSFEGEKIVMSGIDVTEAIRQERIGTAASKISALSQVRQALTERQQAYAQAPGLVADGRDMGSVIFPMAKTKIFLTASAEVRAERRYKQLIGKGMPASMIDLLKDLHERDARDSQRAVAPLKQCEDAALLDTSELTVQQAVDFVVERAAGLRR